MINPVFFFFSNHLGGLDGVVGPQFTIALGLESADKI